MLVSHRHQFIYTKTGKTAGTSVEIYFEPCCVADPTHADGSQGHKEYVSKSGIIGFRGRTTPPGTKWWNHMPAAEIKRLLGKKIWNSYFKFCVIRDPFDRAISLFFYVRKQGKIDNDPSLPDCEQFESWLINRRAAVNCDRYMIDGKFCLDDVIRYERLHADMERICNRLGLRWDPAAFPHTKKGIRPPGTTVAEMYTERAEEIVRQQNAFEFDFFAYKNFIERPVEATPSLLVA